MSLRIGNVNVGRSFFDVEWCGGHSWLVGCGWRLVSGVVFGSTLDS